MSVRRHDLELEVFGQNADEIESHATELGEAYFDGPVRLSIDTSAFVTSFGDDARRYRALVTIRRWGEPE